MRALVAMDAMNQAEATVIDPQIAAMSTPPYPDMPPQQDVDDFLRKKRKAREHKACYPCRQRKVKCDLSRPCQTCRDREHPELCSYHPPNKRQSVDQSTGFSKTDEPASNPGYVTIGRGEFDFLCRKLNNLESSIADLRREMRRNMPALNSYHEPDAIVGSNIDPEVEGRSQAATHADVHGVHMKNVAGQYVHFGRGSIPSMLYALQVNEGYAEQHQIQEMLGKTVLPLFGLDNESATYPFVDLWSLPHGSLSRARELAKSLPSDTQILNLFRFYKDMAYIVYPGVVSIDELESDLTAFLFNRASQSDIEDGVTEQQIYGKSYTWLALLFASLASGAQASVVLRKERELTSQVYVCCSFECLRFSNFLSQSNLESIQSLLVIGNVLTNNLNAGTSWALLGLTIRLAQGLGVHRECPPNTSVDLIFPRSKIWWAVIWQDSLLSMTYDRCSAAEALESTTMPPPQQFGPVDPYHAVMYHLSRVGLEIVRDRARPMSPAGQIARITENRDALAGIMRDAAEYLRDSRKCSTTRETLEHWALYLHSSYHMSELCRPAINPNADPELVKAFKQNCIDNLANTIEAFLGLNNITSLARQSWAALHRALSSALMLGIIGENSRNERAHRLVDRFLNVMSDITNNIDPQEISAPIQRGLSALRKLSSADVRSTQPVDAISESSQQHNFFTSITNVCDQASIMTPTASDSSAQGEDNSPYSVLNTILWGNTGAFVG